MNQERMWSNKELSDILVALWLLTQYLDEDARTASQATLSAVNRALGLYSASQQAEAAPPGSLFYKVNGGTNETA